MRFIFVLLLSVLFLGCSLINRTPKPAPTTQEAYQTGPAQRVVASHYSRSLAGNKTASGEIYNPSALTCAHKTLPFGTMLKVKNPKNNRVVTVKINDRGPFIAGRQLDLSNAAAEQLGVDGVSTVEMQVITRAQTGN